MFSKNFDGVYRIFILFVNLFCCGFLIVLKFNYCFYCLIKLENPPISPLSSDFIITILKMRVKNALICKEIIMDFNNESTNEKMFFDNNSETPFCEESGVNDFSKTDVNMDSHFSEAENNSFENADNMTDNTQTDTTVFETPFNNDEDNSFDENSVNFETDLQSDTENTDNLSTEDFTQTENLSETQTENVDKSESVNNTDGLFANTKAENDGLTQDCGDKTFEDTNLDDFNASGEPEKDSSPKKMKTDFNDTAKLFGVSEEKLTAEFNAYKAAKLFKRINLLAISPKLTVKEMQGIIKSAIDSGLESVTVLPSKAQEAKKIAADRIQIRVACCYPFGAETFAVKLKSVKAAAKIKPYAVEIPFELGDLAQKKTKQIVKEWKKLIKAAGKSAVYMVADIDLLSAHEITSICELAKELQLKLKTSTCVLSDGNYDFQSSTLAAFNGVKLEMTQKVPTSEETLNMFVSGAETVSSANALEAVKGIKRLLGCE